MRDCKELFVAVTALVLAFSSAIMIRTNLLRQQALAEQMQSPGWVAPSREPLQHPDPSLSPRLVVRLQVEHIQQYGATGEGLHVAYRFASPANRESVNTMAAFERIVNSPTYAPLMQAAKVIYGPVFMEEDQAMQMIRAIAHDGTVTVYQFFLSLQSTPAYQACWMTDGVARIERPHDAAPMQPIPGVPM